MWVYEPGILHPQNDVTFLKKCCFSRLPRGEILDEVMLTFNKSSVYKLSHNLWSIIIQLWFIQNFPNTLSFSLLSHADLHRRVEQRTPLNNNWNAENKYSWESQNLQVIHCNKIWVGETDPWVGNTAKRFIIFWGRISQL